MGEGWRAAAHPAGGPRTVPRHLHERVLRLVILRAVGLRARLRGGGRGAEVALQRAEHPAPRPRRALSAVHRLLLLLLRRAAGGTLLARSISPPQSRSRERRISISHAAQSYLKIPRISRLDIYQPVWLLRAVRSMPDGYLRLRIETELIRANLKPESICNSSTFCSSREVLWRKY
jgi:hypothetical protein